MILETVLKAYKLSTIWLHPGCKSDRDCRTPYTIPILRGVEDVTFTQKLAVESHVEPLAVVIVNDDSEGVLLLGGRISVCVLLLSY